MNLDEITFDRLPEAVAYLIKEVSQLRKLVEEKQKTTVTKRIPIGIEEACEIIKKAKSTVYTLVRKRSIPCYKSGKKLYFYEDELLDWISTGRKKNELEIKAEIEKQILKPNQRKPRL